MGFMRRMEIPCFLLPIRWCSSPRILFITTIFLHSKEPWIESQSFSKLAARVPRSKPRLPLLISGVGDRDGEAKNRRTPGEGERRNRLLGSLTASIPAGRDQDRQRTPAGNTPTALT